MKSWARWGGVALIAGVGLMRSAIIMSVDPPVRPIPSPAQLRLVEMGLSQFLDYNLNAFSGAAHVEHNCAGELGRSPPCLPAKLFNPSNQSTDQWVATAKAFGAGEICLTAVRPVPTCPSCAEIPALTKCGFDAAS